MSKEGVRLKPATSISHIAAFVAFETAFQPDSDRLQIKWRRGGDSNPRYLLSIHAFQACALNHSATSPLNLFPGIRGVFPAW